MAESLAVYEEVGFALGWFGVICSGMAFVLLSIKAKIQLRKLDKDEDSESKRNTIILLIFAFGCALFTMLYCLFYGTFGVIPNKLHINITQEICQYTALWMGNAGWQLSRYCFYNFMLWRVKVSFREPLSMRLGAYTFYIYIILIHLWLILALCIIIFWTKRTVTPSGKCAPVMIEILDGFTASDIRTVLWIYDLILTVLLLFLFIKRLFVLTNHNEKVNAYRKKTFILSVIALVTSIIMPVLRNFIDTREWRYFIPLDLIINLSCVVFTFKYKLEMNLADCQCLCYDHRRSRTDSHHIEDGMELNDHDEVRQESTVLSVSPQPTDNEVWDLLAKSQQEHRVNAPHMDIYLAKLKEIEEIQETEIEMSTIQTSTSVKS